MSKPGISIKVDAQVNTAGLEQAARAVAALRYPLFCVDRGDLSADPQWRGPYATEDEAREKADTDDLIAHCRQVKPSELHVRWVDLEDCKTASQVADALDELAHAGEIPVWSWFNWNERVAVLELIDDTIPTRENYKQWLDEHLRVDVYICEDNE